MPQTSKVKMTSPRLHQPTETKLCQDGTKAKLAYPLGHIDLPTKDKMAP